MKKCYLFILFMASLFFLSSSSFASNIYAKEWLGIFLQQAYGVDNPWHTYFYSQLRVIDRHDPLQVLLLEGSLGYQFTQEEALWVGYRWSGLNLFNDFSQENRLFQQYIWQKNFSSRYRIITRNRLEEITRNNSDQVGLRIRERFALEVQHEIFKNALPYYFDEIFLQLNHPTYMPYSTIGENRLFIGFNLYQTNHSWWEIGYINQYRMHNPQQTKNEMSHILSITYNAI